MTATAESRWNRLDAETRRRLDQEYLAELDDWDLPGLTPEGVRVYLEYRHERPDVQITTFEEGQVRKLLRDYAEPSSGPDPVDEEEHIGRLERFGAERLHLTNDQTYVAVMVTLTFLFVIALLIVVSLV